MQMGEQNKSTRRSVLKTASSIMAITTVGTGRAMADESNQSEGDVQVEPEQITNAQVSFDDYTPSPGDTVTMKNRWDVENIIPGNMHQFDALISAERSHQPEITATNVQDSDIVYEWKYESDTVIGSAYHFQARIFSAALSQTVQLDSLVDVPYNASDGTCQARVGSKWPTTAWSSGSYEVQ